jgi:hypothetical protein
VHEEVHLRKLTLAASLGLLACAAPALAQPAPTDPRDEALVRALPHPYEVEEMGDKLGRAVGAISRVPVGDVINSIDPSARAHPDATIADVAGRGDPHFEERMQDEVASLSLKMADLVRGMAVMAPVFRRTLEDFERSIADAVHGVPPRR